MSTPYHLTIKAEEKYTLEYGVGNRYPIGSDLMKLLYRCKSGLACKLDYSPNNTRFPGNMPDSIVPDTLDYDETYLMEEWQAWEIADLITDALEDAGGNFLPLVPKPLNDKLILFTYDIV